MNTQALTIISSASPRRTKGLLLVSLCAALLAACDVDSVDDSISEDEDLAGEEVTTDDEPLADEEARVDDGDFEVVEHEVIAEVVTDDATTITFTREPFGDSPEMFVVGTKIVRADGGIPYEELIDDQGLTPLEVFLAFAPDGAEVPPALRASHEMVARAMDRDAAEIHELVIPRAAVFDSVYCDNYTLFQGLINSIWVSHGDVNGHLTSKSFYDHSVQQNGWHSAVANACNSTNGTLDFKTIYMCSRPRTITKTMTCESVELGDGLRVTKTWSPVYVGGGYYQIFDYQLIGDATQGWVMSYLGLNLASWAEL